MFLGTAHEQAHAPPYAQNIGAHLLVFKDFIAKYDVKNVEFFALAAPAGRDVPKRTVGFGQSGAFGEADISQSGSGDFVAQTMAIDELNVCWRTLSAVGKVYTLGVFELVNFQSNPQVVGT